MACPYDHDNDFFYVTGSDRSQEACAGNSAAGRGNFSRGIFQWEDGPVYVRGMYCQSEWYFQDTGVPVLSSLLIEMTLIALVYVAGGIFLERKGKGFSYGRDCQN